MKGFGQSILVHFFDSLWPTVFKDVAMLFILSEMYFSFLFCFQLVFYFEYFIQDIPILCCGLIYSKLSFNLLSRIRNVGKENKFHCSLFNLKGGWHNFQYFDHRSNCH